MDFSTPVTELKGVGKKYQTLLAKIGVYTLGDMLHFFPRDYKKYEEITKIEELKDENYVAIYGKFLNLSNKKSLKGKAITQANFQDSTGRVLVLFYNRPYIAKQIKYQSPYVLYGKVSKRRDGFVLEQPSLYTFDEYKILCDGLEPIYPLTNGLTNNFIKKCMAMSMESCELPVQEILPDGFLNEIGGVTLKKAYEYMHFPKNYHQVLAAKNRFAAEEFIEFMFQMDYLKEKGKKEETAIVFEKNTLAKKIEQLLPYNLTESQQKVIKDIEKDFASGLPMNRLLQGDVGSGKTIVAFLTMLMVCENGYQCAIMAPTEVLAKQHYENFNSWIQEYHLDLSLEFLTGSQTAKEKRERKESIAQMEKGIVVGTHALFQESVTFQNLAYVVIDEQHRFGVNQRSLLNQKGEQCHVLVMSATPIPRTLALILYGGVDISVMKGMPNNRLPIKNCVIQEESQPAAYKFIEKEIMQGHQAYIICPLIEESESLELENVTEYAEKIKEYFPNNVVIEILHGKMKQKEKDRIMESFSQGNSQILVSTTVVEVGVDVKNATVILIENAERFGLSSLHQLRGRVGRSDLQSYCIMINHSKGKVAKKRLDIMNHSNDGFYIANEDMKMRGFGEMLGFMQSGNQYFKILDVFSHGELMIKCKEYLDSLTAEEKEKLQEDCEEFFYYYKDVSSLII